MNHTVPDIEINEGYVSPELHKKSIMEGGNEDVMELLWHNGQVVMQNQNHRSRRNKRQMSPLQSQCAAATTPPRMVRSSVSDGMIGPSDLFMHEDEMASWLHYPNDENSSLETYLFNNDLLYPTPPSTLVSTASANRLLPVQSPPSKMITSSHPPVSSSKCLEMESGPPKFKNFMHFSRTIKSGQSSLSNMASAKSLPTLSTIVASKETPTTEAQESRASLMCDKPTPINIGGNNSVVGTSSARRDMETCEMSVTSAPGKGGTPPRWPSDDRKRKAKGIDEYECHSEDVEFEYHDIKKQSHSESISTKRSRTAEVHNLSERKRRDRINEKTKALQELIPRSNKSDKASMLDEAIDYLKSLQMQVQMMSMGCSMVPMMLMCSANGYRNGNGNRYGEGHRYRNKPNNASIPRYSSRPTKSSHCKSNS